MTTKKDRRKAEIENNVWKAWLVLPLVSIVCFCLLVYVHIKTIGYENQALKSKLLKEAKG